MKRYSVILADCPWSYRDKNSNGKRGASHKYPVMTVKDLMALNVQQLCAMDCTLFMWSTSPMIPEALKVMEAWGFKFKTVAFTWIKLNKRFFEDHPPPFEISMKSIYRIFMRYIFKGLGHYTRGNPEFVLLGTRGKKMPREDKSVSSVIISPRQEHSQKPIEVQERIRRLYGPVPALELFARKRTAYFDTLGDELDGKDIREVLR